MWITAQEFADLVKISPRKARLALQRASCGKSWRGYHLKVRLIESVGGRSGTSYQVWSESLPKEFRPRSSSNQIRPTEPPLPHSFDRKSDLGRKALWFRQLFQDVLGARPRSKERAEALKALVGQTVTDWNGNPKLLKRRTLFTWLKCYEVDGLQALSRQARSDRGQKRVVVSRVWDRAVSERFDVPLQQEIAAGLRQQVRGLIKSGATGKIVAALASDYLKKATIAHGFPPIDATALDRICKVPRELIRSEQHYKKVYRHKHDRKASEDDRPRIRRSIDGMAPMDCVVMDVHHVNILLRRKDGTTATPKLLAFMDIATRRVWGELVFIETRGGVRNADVIEAFVAMACDPAYGLPQTLYCDNGTEYRFADFLNDALQLLAPTTDGRARSRVIRALPYNAAAKPIEAWFGHFEQQFLKSCQGYIGDDRMNPMRPVLGKLPKPYEGGFEAFQSYFKELLKAYEVLPQTGALKGESPRQTFENHVRGGWTATVIDPDRLQSVFTKPEVRTVRQHGISVAGRKWTCDELDTYFHDTVTAHVPQYHGYNALRLTGPDGRFIGIARPEAEYAFLDPRGAKRSADRTARRNRALRQVDKAVPNIDLGAELLKLGRGVSDVAPNVPNGTIRIAEDGNDCWSQPLEYGEALSRSTEERDRKEIAAIRKAFVKAMGGE